jgi:hypothetical protein
MLAHHVSPAKVLIQSPSDPRSVSNVAPDIRSDNNSVTSRLSWASLVISSKRTGIPLVSTQACHQSLFRSRRRNRRADGCGQWRCRSSERSRHRFGKRLHHQSQDANHSPANETVVAGRVWPKLSDRSSHGAPDRDIQKMPLRKGRSLTQRTSAGLTIHFGVTFNHKREACWCRFRRVWSQIKLQHWTGS